MKIKLSEKPKLIIIVSLGFVYNFSIILNSIFLMQLINNIEQKSRSYKELVIRIVLLLILQILSYGAYNLMKSKYVNKQIKNLKINLLTNIMKRDLVTFHKSNTDDYLSFFYNDVDYLKGKYYFRIIDIIENSIMFILAMLGIIYIYPYYLVAVFIVFAFSMIIPLVFSVRGKNIVKEISTINKENMKWFRNIFNGYKIIRSFKIEDTILDEGIERFSIIQNEHIKLDVFMNFVQVGLSFILSLMSLLTFIGGGYLVFIGKLSIGALIALAQLLFHVAQPVIGITSAVNDIKSTNNIIEECKDILSYKNLKKESLVEHKDSTPIEFQNVVFSYPNSKNIVLKNFSFKFEKGKKYAIIGENGSGKSTILNLIFGLYNNYEGKILLYGNDIKLINDYEILDYLTYLEQDVFIFHKSVIDNIKMQQKDISKNKFNYIVDRLEMDYLLEGEDNGIKRNIDSKDISGGESKKIGITRSMLRNSKILLIDEADSTLDEKSCMELKLLLLEEERDLIISITHSLDENLSIYDEIIVIHNGEIEKQYNNNKIENSTIVQNYFQTTLY